MSGVTGSHHVLGIKHLSSELGHGEGPVLLGAPGGEGSEPGHEEVETREGDHVDRQLPQVSVELAGEPEAGGYPGHGDAHQVVQVPVGWGAQLQRSEPV